MDDHRLRLSSLDRYRLGSRLGLRRQDRQRRGRLGLGSGQRLGSRLLGLRLRLGRGRLLRGLRARAATRRPAHAPSDRTTHHAPLRHLRLRRGWRRLGLHVRYELYGRLRHAPDALITELPHRAADGRGEEDDDVYHHRTEQRPGKAGLPSHVLCRASCVQPPVGSPITAPGCPSSTSAASVMSAPRIFATSITVMIVP